MADIMEGEVMVRCNACGQELGTFDLADKPITISNNELHPLTADGTIRELFLHTDNGVIDDKRIKPCPFCGGKAEIITNDDELRGFTDDELEYSVCCTRCSCNSGWGLSEDDAVNAWNTRNSGAAIRTIVDAVMNGALKRRNGRS